MAEYTEDSIRSLKGLEAIKIRPHIYIQNVGRRGNLHLLHENIGNATDESRLGYGDKLIVATDLYSGRFCVIDRGRGIPLGKLDEVMLNTHSGGKFDNDAYKISLGLNGVGLTATNALGKIVHAAASRNGKFRYIQFRDGDGKLYADINLDLTDKSSFDKVKAIMVENKLHPSIMSLVNFGHGTYIDYTPNIEWMKEVGLDSQPTKELIDFSSCVALTDIDWHRNFYAPQIQEFKYPKNMIEALDIYGRKTLSKNGVRIVPDTVRIPIVDSLNDIKLNAVLFITPSSDNNTVLSITNGTMTSEGTQYTGMRTAMTNVFGSLAKQKAPKNLDIKAGDLRGAVSGIMLIEMGDAQFDSQVKDRVVNKELIEFTKYVFTKHLNQFIKDNPKAADKIIVRAIQQAKIRAAMKKAKANVLKSAGNKIDVMSLVKYDECREKNPLLREIYITEGDSAGGAISSNGFEFQAALRTKGKVLNVLHSSVISDTHKTFVNVLGVAPGNNIDLKKLRFNKIIIAADADVDGSHIRALWFGFFWKYYPQLIENGYIYTVMPPLFVIKAAIKGKKKELYVKDNNIYKEFIFNIVKGNFDLCDSDHNVMSTETFRYIFKKSELYLTSMNSLSKMYSIPATIIEKLVIVRDTIHKIKEGGSHVIKKGLLKKNLKITTNELTIKLNNSYYEIHSAKELYSIHTDDFNNMTNAVMKGLSNILAIGYTLKKKNQNMIITGTMYELFSYMNNIIAHSGVKTETARMKGLGEMNPGLVRKTLLDPDTRILARVTGEDVKHYAPVFETLLGNDIDNKKKFFITGKLNVA